MGPLGNRALPPGPPWCSAAWPHDHPPDQRIRRDPVWIDEAPPCSDIETPSSFSGEWRPPSHRPDNRLSPGHSASPRRDEPAGGSGPACPRCLSDAFRRLSLVAHCRRCKAGRPRSRSQWWPDDAGFAWAVMPTAKARRSRTPSTTSSPVCDLGHVLPLRALDVPIVAAARPALAGLRVPAGRDRRRRRRHPRWPLWRRGSAATEST
jgi:hypothetical protein